METTIKQLSISAIRSVLTVPMRNGNILCAPPAGRTRKSSYRTYEEWKLYSKISRRYVRWVLTVPMRNGNLPCLESSTQYRTFLPYLWGMETTQVTSRVQHETKFLPYLWGMETHACPIVQGIFVRSYRTYEEWKLGKEITNRIPAEGSYRTYEEWKHHKRFISNLDFSVLTVPMRNGNLHHWKIRSRRSTFLPYLWGMETHHNLVYSTDRERVLTVPMRNGNFWRMLMLARTKFVLTVPMRNGN